MSGAAAPPVRLLVSDVDGTLVTPDKQLTDAAVAASRRLRDAGIRFAVISSRPPRGLRMLVQPLGLDQPVAGFNGGRIVWPDGRVLEDQTLDAETSRRAIATLQAQGAGIWFFAGDRWLVADPDGPYVGRERRTVQFDPEMVQDFAPFYGQAGKIVGVSQDFDLLARCVPALKSVLGQSASASRSQPYYLDVTPLAATKGTAIRTLSRLLAIPQEEIAVIGDMENDVSMFVEAGLSIAMGNAPPQVQSAAQFVTLKNTEDGFAAAVDRFILPRAPSG